MTDIEPDRLRYTTDHEWVRREGDHLRVGITEFAQAALGDLVYIDLPAEGTRVLAGEVFGEIESTKSVSDLYAPADGTVIEVNDALTEDPGVVNRDPYGQGWLCVLHATADDSRLLDAAAYGRHTGASA